MKCERCGESNPAEIHTCTPDFSKAGFGKPQGVINTLNKQPEPEPLIDGWPLYSGLPEPEPVAWMRSDKGHIDFHKHPDYIPLYTAPPQREWVGLTDKEIEQIVDAHWNDPSMFVEAIEAKLKEKNT